MSGEKTEKPTPQKRRKARRDGQIARSADVGAWLGMLAASFLLPMTISRAAAQGRALLAHLPGMVARPDAERAVSVLGEGLRGAVLTVAPLALCLLVLGVVAAAAQGGLHMATKLMMPKFSRVNPFSGIKRTLGPQAWWEGVKALVKSVALGAVLYTTLGGLVPLLMAAGTIPFEVLLGTIGDGMLTLMRTAAAAGLVMAAADYLVVRRRTGKQLRMSKQEVKEEHKRSEGDPQLKGAIRQRQMAISRNRMMAELPTADVVLVNPTHVAVALRYDAARGAPRVVAKGAGTVARRIREVAMDNRIPLVQDVPLARSLHAACDLGAEIPPELYGAVARVLAFVLGLKARGSAAGTHRAPDPTSTTAPSRPTAASSALARAA
jgi:flagellar biosynthetic protein FlhB